MKEKNINEILESLESKGLIVWDRVNDTVSLTSSGKLIAEVYEKEIEDDTE